MPRETLQAVVFDFDGTLATLTIDFELMRRQVAAVAKAFLDGQYVDDGQPILEWVDHLAGLLEQSDGRDTALEFHTRCRFIILDMELKAAQHGRLFPFSLPMLANLRARGVATGIITRNCMPAVKAVFPEVQASVDALLTRDCVERVKPHPLHLTTALNLLGVAPHNALMVGDHPLDVETGHRAGVRAAAVASGRMTTAALAAAQPEFLAEDCAKLLQQLDAKGFLPNARTV